MPNFEISSVAVYAFASHDHKPAYRVDQVSEGIDLRDDAQPIGHKIQRIDRITCEEHRHREELAYTHKALARLNDARDDERESGKEPRTQQHAGQHSEDGLRLMPDRNVHGERNEINDGRLYEAAEAGGDRFAEDKRASQGGAHQKLVHDAQVTLPDHCDAVEDCAEQHALGEDPGRDEREVADLSGVDAVDMSEDLAEHHQPQHRLHCA